MLVLMARINEEQIDLLGQSPFAAPRRDPAAEGDVILLHEMPTLIPRHCRTIGDVDAYQGGAAAPRDSLEHKGGLSTPHAQLDDETGLRAQPLEEHRFEMTRDIRGDRGSRPDSREVGIGRGR